jgi:aldehyde:ferredoxin oxidoreductase
VARLEEIANRIATLERMFNLEAGARMEDDALPERFSHVPIVVAGEEKIVSRDVQDRLKRDYYQVRDWDEKGRPAQAVLKTLRIKGRKT